MKKRKEKIMSKTDDNPEDLLTIVEAPNENLERKWNSLHGIDYYKHLVLEHSLTCLDKTRIESWCKKYYPESNGLQDLLTYELGFSGKILFVGDAGTGKTQFAEGLANALGKIVGKLYLIEVGLLRSKYVGLSSWKVTKVFKYAKEKAKEAPVLLFIDEFDSCAPNRNNSEMHEEIKAAVNTLLKEIENITPSDKVIVIAATNLFEQAVDYAADRRFDMVVNFKRPNFFQRLSLLNVLLKQFEIDFEQRFLLAKKTNGYTQADIKKVIKHALNTSLSSNRRLKPSDLFGSLSYVKPTRHYNGENRFWTKTNEN
jgi:SpoVK/Ycf46/Vps4 family AAA+-type ATPase